jgi:glutathione-independent formaldehyde dehydrogenase
MCRNYHTNAATIVTEQPPINGYAAKYVIGGLHMKAVVFKDKQVVVDDVPKPAIEQSTDAILKVTSAAICGSDLHMYENRTNMEDGKTLGHEILGVIEEVGDGVKQLKKGDRVVLPFNIGCGKCANCVRGFSNACLFLNDAHAGAGFGYADQGPYDGGQAEYVRIPAADYLALKVPGSAHDEHEDDFLMLADIFPTAFHAATVAHVEPGKAVVIIGAGPVGLLSVTASQLLGAREIYIVDHFPTRLQKAKELGAVPIDMSKGDPVKQITDIRHKNALLAGALRPGEEKILDGVDCGIDAIGYQAHDQEDFNQENPMQAVTYLSQLVLPTGHICLIGVYLPQDPGAVDANASKGVFNYPLGMLWNKGITVGGSQCPVKMYDRKLRDTVIAGGAQPGTIVTHHISIDEAPEMYKRFDAREDGVHKVVITFK